MTVIPPPISDNDPLWINDTDDDPLWSYDPLPHDFKSNQSAAVEDDKDEQADEVACADFQIDENEEVEDTRTEDDFIDFAEEFWQYHNPGFDSYDDFCISPIWTMMN